MKLLVVNKKNYQIFQQNCPVQQPNYTSSFNKGYSTIPLKFLVEPTSKDFSITIYAKEMSVADAPIFKFHRYFTCPFAQIISFPILLPAGGWYSLDIIVTKKNRICTKQRIKNIGVGEIFLIAGQSYACGYNDKLLSLNDPLKRAISFDLQSKNWRIANDPQPCDGKMGTIWPPLADMLINILQMPVGFINTAVGATSTSQWLPGSKIFANMVQAAKHAGKFRAVLWQQGESDVIENTSTETYVSRLIKIRSEFASKIGYDPPWLLAKSTLHPTVYNKPEQQIAIRKAIDILCQYHNFEYGPDTDMLDGENRGDMQSMRHFTAIGQYRAALLWFTSIFNFLQKTTINKAKSSQP